MQIGGPTPTRRRTEVAADCVSGPYGFEVLEGVTHWVPEGAADRLGGLPVEHVSSTRD